MLIGFKVDSRIYVSFQSEDDDLSDESDDDMSEDEESPLKVLILFIVVLTNFLCAPIKLNEPSVYINYVEPFLGWATIQEETF